MDQFCALLRLMIRSLSRKHLPDQTHAYTDTHTKLMEQYIFKGAGLLAPTREARLRELVAQFRSEMRFADILFSPHKIRRICLYIYI